MDECLGPTIPKCPAKRNGFCPVCLHIVEAAMLQYRRPFGRIDLDIEKVRNESDLTRKISLHVLKVQKQQVWQITDFPPSAYILPKVREVEWVPILLQPSHKIFARVLGRTLKRWADPTWSVIDGCV